MAGSMAQVAEHLPNKHETVLNGVAQAPNPSYSGDQEDWGSRPAQAKKCTRPSLKNN
jgi:hypothetical protein